MSRSCLFPPLLGLLSRLAACFQACFRFRIRGDSWKGLAHRIQDVPAHLQELCQLPRGLPSVFGVAWSQVSSVLDSVVEFENWVDLVQQFNLSPLLEEKRL